jgi:hypothetical protein
MPKNLDDLNSLTLFSRSDEGSDWFRKVKRIDLIKTQIMMILKVMKQLSICATAGTKRLDRKRGRTSLAKMGEEQGGQYGFAYAGVGPGDENCSGAQIRHYEIGVTVFSSKNVRTN